MRGREGWGMARNCCRSRRLLRGGRAAAGTNHVDCVLALGLHGRLQIGDALGTHTYTRARGAGAGGRMGRAAPAAAGSSREQNKGPTDRRLGGATRKDPTGTDPRRASVHLGDGSDAAVDGLVEERGDGVHAADDRADAGEELADSGRRGGESDDDRADVEAEDETGGHHVGRGGVRRGNVLSDGVLVSVGDQAGEVLVAGGHHLGEVLELGGLVGARGHALQGVFLPREGRPEPEGVHCVRSVVVEQVVDWHAAVH
mmetsp:Transcript_14633/g.55102  ORF Transcript_14633/g.55102 Transcript_14633/m.55102 type:complete len:257 (+) Transcript_14633:884-1654(+)